MNTEANTTPETAIAPVNPEPTQPTKAKPRKKAAAVKKVSKKKAATKKTAKGAKPVKKGKAKGERRADGLLVGSAGAKLVDAICASKGATHKEMCEIVKWKSCLPFAMKSVAQAKVKLRKEREPNGEVRYYGRR
jgi:hypothetical protein